MAAVGVTATATATLASLTSHCRRLQPPSSSLAPPLSRLTRPPPTTAGSTKRLAQGRPPLQLLPLQRDAATSSWSLIGSQGMRQWGGQRGVQGAQQRCRSQADESDSQPSSSSAASGSGSSSLVSQLSSVGLLLFWAAFSYYGFVLSPSQTPFRDQYFLEKLVGLRADDGFVMNQVLVNLWNIMGVWPLIYASLLIPGSRTDRTSVPAWPFVGVSFALGAFALLPYFAFWSAGQPKVPTEEERTKWGLKILESKITAAGIVLGTLVMVAGAASAPSADWIEFLQYFRESRLTHVTTTDFFVLTTMAPFWLYNDMSFRNWAPRDSWGLALLALPLIGPALYIALRPPLPSLDPVLDVESESK